jgi:hypothetical protein
MRARHLLIPVLAASCLFAREKTVRRKEAEQKQSIEETKTQTVAFPAGGVLRLKHSIGDLNIEVWDNPGVEITTVRSAKEAYSERGRGQAKAKLDKVIVTAEVHGDELVIATAFPRRRRLPPSWPLGSPVDFNLEYHIRIPRSARLAIDHELGSVNVEGVTGDIDANVLQGEIVLHLPEDAKYSIDAKTEYGNVNSDFPGEWRRGWFSQKAFEDSPRPAHTLKLRVGYGDIVLLKTRTPKYPEPGAGTPKGTGL